MAEMIERPPPGSVTIRWLGQGAFLFCSPGGVTWTVDPYLSDYSGSQGRVNRLNPAPVTAEAMQVDAVLGSHNHGDHIDPVTFPLIARHSEATFYAAAEGAQHLRELGIAHERVRAVAVGDEVTLGAPQRSDVRATVVFADHDGDAVGYVFTVGACERPVRVYLTGDTLYGQQLLSAATRHPDVLCVCINGRGGNMSYQDAVQLAQQLEPRLVIPMHFAVMPHNTIDPQLFLDAASAADLPAEARVLAVGESIQFKSFQ